MQIVTYKNAILAGIAYCLVMATLLVLSHPTQNVFGISLSYEEQFYEWNIINMPEAREELFKSALLHTVVLAALLGLYYYLYDYPRLKFAPLSQSD